MIKYSSLHRKYIEKCYDTLRVGAYYKILDAKNVYFGILLKKNVFCSYLLNIYEFELLTESGIIYCDCPYNLIKLELSGEINKVKLSLIEAKLQYL